MSRCGYSEDFDDPLELGRWRGQVESALRGKRGQRFLRELIAALDALPQKRLVENALAESVGDRPTKSHEHVFLLAKSQSYYYDADAVKEKATGLANGNSPRDKHEAAANAGDERLRTRANLSKISARSARSARSVWTVPTEPYSGSHFAVMPQALATRCVLAGCRPAGIVLDPFLGSGTVARVAEQLGRRWFGCDINPDYAPLIAERTAQRGLFAKQEEDSGQTAAPSTPLAANRTGARS